LVVLAKGAITNTGSITANANFTTGNMGGGAGGVVILASPTSITNAGTISANGGDGAPSTNNSVLHTCACGGGGGGIIRYISPTIADTGTDSVSPGAAGTMFTTQVTSTTRVGGSGGGASGGAGGPGATLLETGFEASVQGGQPGVILKTTADPTALF
jgi:hypothetical protein